MKIIKRKEELISNVNLCEWYFIKNFLCNKYNEVNLFLFFLNIIIECFKYSFLFLIFVFLKYFYRCDFLYFNICLVL